MATEKKATVHSRVTAQSRARSNNNNNKKTKSNSKPKLTVSPLKEGSLAARKARRAAPKKTSEEKADEVADDEEMHLHYSRHYELHCLNNPELALEEDYCHWCQIRKYSTHERAPIRIINTVDSATLPKNFRFIESSINLPGVKLADEDFNVGCECEDDSQCKRNGCSCLGEMIVPENDDPLKKIYAYHTHGSKKGILRSAFLNSRDPIYECHSACQCSEECANRVVGQGRVIPLQIFRTSDNRGWGVRSSVDIKCGQFIDTYIGEVMTAHQANYRRKKSVLAQQKEVYLFAMDKFVNEDSPDERLRGPPLEVDGEFMSGPTRFINHSCGPNLRIFGRVGDHSNKHVHDLAFFAIEDIQAGTELTFDYIDGNEHHNNSRDARQRKDTAKCLCGSENCRGYIF